MYRIEPVDLGTFRHEVMQRLFGRIDQATSGWAGMTAAEIRSLASQVIKELAHSMPVFSSSGRNSFLLEIVSGQLIDAAEVQLYMVQAGNFKPWGLELKFGPDDQSSQLSWSSAKGVQLQLVGRIDRIDLAQQHKLFAVIDYKSRVVPVRLDHIYHGLALQLGCYLLAARKILSESQGTRWHCAAVLLAGLAGGVGRDEASDDPKQRKGLLADYKYRGLIDSRYLQQFDSSHQHGRHPLFGYFINKEGQVGDLGRGPLVPAGAIDALAGCVQQHITTIADKILDGDVQVQPYRSGTQSPCPVCDYLPVCRFDPTQSRYRGLESLGKNEVLAALNIAWPKKDVKVTEQKNKR